MDQNFLNDLYNVADFINKTAFFGMLGWFYILKEIFMGEAGGVAGECSQAVKEAFNNMRFIVTVDWSIYKSGLKVDHFQSPPWPCQEDPSRFRV